MLLQEAWENAEMMREMQGGDFPVFLEDLWEAYKRTEESLEAVVEATPCTEDDGFDEWARAEYEDGRAEARLRRCDAFCMPRGSNL